MSGSRSTRNTDGGEPIHGDSAWPSSFTGPARYSPSTNAAATDDNQQAHGEPYAPYAQAGSEYADPYAADAYAADPYAGGYPGSAYPADPYAAAQYGTEPYSTQHAEPYGSQQQYVGDGAPYQGGESYEYDYAATNYPDTSTYVGDGYPPHDYDAFSAREGYGAPENYGGAAGYNGAEGGYGGGDGYGYAQAAEAGHTQLLTEPRFPDVAEDLAGLQAPSSPLAPASPYDEPESGEIPGQRSPGDRRPRTAGRRPAGRPGTPRKVSWVGRAVQGVVLASLLGGVTAYVAFEKTVTVSVDGATRQIHSFASTVGAALASDNVNTGGHDLVSPAPSAGLADNSTITVKYGRPVGVTVNGKAEQVWVHSTTVGGALQELGVRTQGARFVSVSTDTPIARSGMAFSLFTMRHITFLVDGKSDQMNTTDATVQQAMADAGISLHNQDTASVAMTSLPVDGQTISILRVTGTTEVKQEPIPYTVTKQDDPNSYVGATTVVTSGSDGVATVTYALQIVNGVKQKPKQVSRVVTKQPVAEVEKVGTKALPTNVSQLNWAALANCESGGNPKAVDGSGTYYGLYQFSVSTWSSLGGSGLPSNASASEQTTRAELLYQRSGSGQWPVCGHNLFS
ncbi:MAG: ubiquitin-like domain-containing protein [Actinocrinis sp.]